MTQRGPAGYPVVMANLEQAAMVRENSILQLFLDWEDGDALDHVDEVLKRFEAAHAGDNDQSAKAVGGNALQKLVQILVEDGVKSLNERYGLNLGCTSDRDLKRRNPPGHLDRVKRNLLVDYGEYGSHLPDADVVVYRRDNSAVVCIVSCKKTLRDRLKQTTYWKLKLLQSPITMHVRVCLVTPDNDGELVQSSVPPRKNYAIANVDLDGAYLLRPDVVATNRIKHFSSFENDLRKWGGGGTLGGFAPVPTSSPACGAVSASARCSEDAAGLSPWR